MEAQAGGTKHTALNTVSALGYTVCDLMPVQIDCSVVQIRVGYDLSYCIRHSIYQN